MVDNNFLETLFEKNEIVSQEEKNKFLSIIEEKNRKENVSKVIDSFSDKIDLAKQIIEPRGLYAEEGSVVAKEFPPIMPLYYDNSGIWWKWSYAETKWDIIDEVDLMNYISFSSPANTINSKERSEILQAFKQVARQNKPLEVGYNYLQFKDEVINLETGDRFEASYKYFLTNPIPHKLSKETETPTIDKIFTEWVGVNNVRLLKEIIAFCLLRDYPIHRIFCFIGAGMNGKSKYLELLRKFIGTGNCCSTELDTLINSRFEITRLHKKLVCQMGETNFNEMNKTSQLKKLSGGDLIGFEYKNKNPFEAINYAKILIATNNLPATTDKTVGFYRRWVIIDFPNTFNEKKDILSDIPEEEYGALAMQSINTLIELLKNREFHNEGSIEERMKKYEDHSNPLEKFLKEYTVEDFNGFIWKHDFSKKLNDWCKQNRFRDISDVVIGKKMKELSINQSLRSADWTAGKQFRAWIGIKFREETNN